MKSGNLLTTAVCSIQLPVSSSRLSSGHLHKYVCSLDDAGDYGPQSKRVCAFLVTLAVPTCVRSMLTKQQSLGDFLEVREDRRAIKSVCQHLLHLDGGMPLVSSSAVQRVLKLAGIDLLRRLDVLFLSLGWRFPSIDV